MTQNPLQETIEEALDWYTNMYGASSIEETELKELIEKAFHAGASHQAEKVVEFMKDRLKEEIPIESVPGYIMQLLEAAKHLDV